MNISSLSINRPVLASVISIVILLFGAIGFSYLGVREYPSVDPPIVSVSTSYTGANSDVMEAQITEPLEASINGIAGIKSITSSSSDGRSNITIEFDLGMDMSDAANDVRDRVSRAIRNLPPDADPPIVTKADANSDPIMSLTIQSSKRDLLDLTDIANNVIKERLQTVPGVSGINIWGEKRYAMRLYLDPKKLAAYGITPSDIKTALSRENIELPTGRVEGYFTDLSIRTLGRLETPTEFNNLIIKEKDGVAVKMRDIGRADYAPENERSTLRGNELIPMVGVAISPQPGSNYIAIADEVYKRMDQIKKELPTDIVVTNAFDSTISIRKGITEVEETILLAFGLVILVIFIFLRSWRTTLIPMVAIPISLIGSFFVMYIAGFSINLLSLLGIVLATGLVVDDAIVVLENIYSKIEQGMDPYKAGHKGSHEIYFAIISTTITLVAVFMPILFLQGITGRLFREFGMVVAGSVLISAVVSLTLTPMMCSRMLKGTHKREGRILGPIGRGIDRLSESYGRSLDKFIGKRYLAYVVMAISLLIFVFVGRLIPSELAPMEDKSRFSISATAPEGTSFEAMDGYMKELAAYVDTISEKNAIIALTAPGSGSSNSGFVRVMLKQPNERMRTQADIADQVSAYLKGKPFARAFVTQDQTISTGRGGGLPVQFVVQAVNFEKLKEAVPLFLSKAQADGRFQVVDVNLKFNKPELVVSIDRDKARASGITVVDIAEALQLYFSGQRYGYFIRNGKQYYVIGQADRQFRDDPSDLLGIYLRSSSGKLVDLGSLVTTSEQSIPPQRYRYNRYVAATFSASLVPGYTLGQGIDAMREISKSTLDDTFSTTLTGTSQQFEESSNSIFFAFFLALVLVYLVLAAQFESFRDPLIIMFTVPLALAGAILSLWIFGQTLNIFSQIGIIVLVGIVTKNGILIVEFANQKKEQGMNRIEAVQFAARQRLRPILMTSLATMFGALPIALALGAASTSRASMGITIIGGLLFALILTLYVIPALYTYISTVKPNVISHEE
ncbi:efflux RND transporter permease subunit [Williamwhitmania taraxaci]|uniref:Multidrug efflux pump n=1 Tax=Williamwhitmania taraxaci TaxID=1640674 RepID=A0A1G6MI23_9BACT|nr:efflux RND transporter permease subunit [Williamwhitmania taraxaci]SDC55182.1 multidrug efflux pump [Williamwhitmania taraxaci]